MDDLERRVQLAQLLAGPVGRPTWDALWALLLAWPDGTERERAIAEADAGLAAWPDGERHRSADWAPLYVAGGVTPVARIVRSIELYRRSDQGTVELTRLAGSPHLAGLRRLRFVRCDLDGSAWRAFKASPHLRLHAFELHHTELASGELTAVLRSPPLAGVRELRLGQCGLRGPDLAAALAALPPTVVTLDLPLNGIGPRGARALVERARTLSLEHLRLADNPLGDDGAAALADWPKAGLRTLDLAKTAIGAKGKAALAAGPHLAATTVIL